MAFKDLYKEQLEDNQLEFSDKNPNLANTPWARIFQETLMKYNGSQKEKKENKKLGT